MFGRRLLSLALVLLLVPAPAPARANVLGVVTQATDGPKTLYIYARQGALLFSYEDETEVIPEGKAYRVTLGPPDDDSSEQAGRSPASRAQQQPARQGIFAGAAGSGRGGGFDHTEG